MLNECLLFSPPLTRQPGLSVMKVEIAIIEELCNLIPLNRKMIHAPVRGVLSALNNSNILEHYIFRSELKNIQLKTLIKKRSSSDVKDSDECS